MVHPLAIDVTRSGGQLEPAGVDWLDGMDGRNGDSLPVDVVNPRIRRRNPLGIDYHDVPLPEADVWVRHADKTDVGRGRSFLVHRIQDGRRRGLGRDRTRDRWTLTKPRWWRG